ncbi:hypothetical protein F5879DRAFT_1038902 [Lentinula edodes]|uniref:Uncharacterized protein n=1 Tax=Lentinula edodes TaxID=5353 RepID=A0A1Q3EEC8_LENED|nr:hypothetical protein F5879DRAFT_1038902 [Lentinula edodes]GAW05519.1 hypothetical protein LENED_007382 [Lentinula edodes]
MRVVPAYFFALVSATYAAPAPVASTRSFHNTEAEAYASNLPSESRTPPELRAFSADVNDTMNTNLAYGSNISSGTSPQARGTPIALELEGRQPGNDKPTAPMGAHSPSQTAQIRFVEKYGHTESGAPQGFKAGAPNCVDELLKWMFENWQPNTQYALTYVNSFYEVLSDGFAQPPDIFEFYVSGFAECFAKTAFVQDPKNPRKSIPPPPSCRVVVKSNKLKGKITVYQEDMKKGTSMLFSKELPENLWRPGKTIY